MTRPADNTTAQCPVCGTSDVTPGAPVCTRCGATIELHVADGGRGPAPLAAGDRVAGRFVIDSVRWSWPGVTYYNARLESHTSERVLLVERAATDPDPLAEAGLAKPGE